MNDLITIDGEKLQLPKARSEGATRLYQRLERLPQHWDGEVAAARIVIAVTTEANRLPADVEPNSVVTAAFNCAVTGLLPGPFLGHAHFIPFKENRAGIRRCQLIIGYKGYLHLAYGTGFLKDARPEVVLRDEEFERWNDSAGAQLRHKLRIDRDEQWSNVIGAYCAWKSTTGGGDIAMVTRKELETLYRRGNVWHSDPIAMCKKTAIRRASKNWKTTGRMANAVYLDEMADRDEPQPCLVDHLEEEEPTPSLTEFDSKAIAADYRKRLDNATSQAARNKVWDEIQADGNLEQADRDDLAAVYQTKLETTGA